MQRHKPSEAYLLQQIALLSGQFKQQKQETRISKKRNRKLAQEILIQKLKLKELEDERVILQKEIFDQRYNKTICEESNTTLNNHLSSVLKDINALQTKIISIWRNTHIKQNQSSSRKYFSTSFSATKVKHLPKVEQPLDLTPLKNSDLDFQIEENNFSEERPVLGFVEDLSKTTEFTVRDIPINFQPGTGSIISISSVEEENSQHSNHSQIIEQQIELLSKTDFIRTSEPELATAEQASIPSINTEQSSSLGSFFRRDTVLLQKDRKPDNYFRTDNEKNSEEPPFLGFVEDLNKTTEFTELIKKLSSIRSDVLRDELNAYSLSIFESNPEAKNTTPSVLEENSNMLSCLDNVPQLDFLPLHCLSSILDVNDIEEQKGSGSKDSHVIARNSSNVSPDSSSQTATSSPIVNGKTEEGETTQRLSNNHSPEQKSASMPDSASDSLPDGRMPRRARGVVTSYKEKSLNKKLRR